MATFEETGCSSKEAKEHVFAYVHWKEVHPKGNWFGTSATICTNLYELNANPFLPVQKIACKYAHANLKVVFDTGTENVFCCLSYINKI